MARCIGSVSDAIGSRSQNGHVDCVQALLAAGAASDGLESSDAASLLNLLFSLFLYVLFHVLNSFQVCCSQVLFFRLSFACA